MQKALDAGAPPRRSASNRDSMQRKRNWWLPYVVLEFDKNEVLVDALGGDLSKPEWNYRADLCALLNSPCSTLLTPTHSDVSRASTISVSAYLRTAQCVQGQDDMGNDILMARVDLVPVLDAHVRPAPQCCHHPLLTFHLIFTARIRSVVQCYCWLRRIPSEDRLQASAARISDH